MNVRLMGNLICSSHHRYSLPCHLIVLIGLRVLLIHLHSLFYCSSTALCNIDSWIILHSRVSPLAGRMRHFNFCSYSCFIISPKFRIPYFNCILKAKMGMTEEFEVSLQVLRGFDTDISVEVNEIKV